MGRGLKDRCPEIVSYLKEDNEDSIYYKEFKDGAFVFEIVSEKKASNSGVTWEDMIGKTDFDFLPKEEAQKAHDDDLLVFRTGNSIIKEEELTRPNGKKVWVSTRKFPWRDPDGNIIGVIGTSRDITEKKEAEEALVQSMAEKEKAIAEKEKAIKDLSEANEHKSRMTHILFHDLRSPLLSIELELKFLERGSFGPIDESVRVVVNGIFQKVRSKRQMVTDYLSSISIMGTEIGEKELLDIREDIIDPILEEFSKEIENKKIIVDMTLGAIPGNRLFVKANKTWLTIVYRNLIDNTIKHTPCGGKIAFGFEEQDGKIKLNVYSSGAPVPPDMTEKIFEMFESNTSSTGIGLSISRDLIRKNGGDMWYENSWDGHPNFVFTIPKD